MRLPRLPLRDTTSGVLEIAGLVAVAIGVGLWSLPAGIVVGGFAAIVLGLALGAPEKESDQ